MLFSIIVPVYNVEKYLKECLNSIITQVENQVDAEILLIDDGSTDQSGVICDEYMVKYPNLIRVFHNVNQGLLLTRRYGFNEAKGDYIINCDSDDTMEENCIQELREIINAYSPDVIIYNVNVMDNFKKTVLYKNLFTNKSFCKVSKIQLLNKYYNSNDVISMWGKVFKRSCLNLNLTYDEFKNKSFGEDTLQSAEIYTNAKNIFYLNKELYNYRIGSGMTKRFNQNYYCDFKNINNYVKKYKEEWNLPNYDILFSTKLFIVVGRAITQSRYQKKMSYYDEKKYLMKIRNDNDVIFYEQYYMQVRSTLSRNHRLFCTLLLNRHYALIYVLLKLKNILSFNNLVFGRRK